MRADAERKARVEADAARARAAAEAARLAADAAAGLESADADAERAEAVRAEAEARRVEAEMARAEAAAAREAASRNARRRWRAALRYAKMRARLTRAANAMRPVGPTMTEQIAEALAVAKRADAVGGAAAARVCFATVVRRQIVPGSPGLASAFKTTSPACRHVAMPFKATS